MSKVLKYLGLGILLFLYWSLLPDSNVFCLIMFLVGCELYSPPVKG
jgi:hypothetical protein